MRKLKFNINLNSIENIKEAKINKLNIYNVNYNIKILYNINVKKSKNEKLQYFS